MNKKKIAFVSQNVAPFRLNWMEELSKYFDIVFYHLGEYHETVNKKYISGFKTALPCENIAKKFLSFHIFDIQKILDANADLLLLDGYGFIGQVFLIAALNRRKIPYYLTMDGGFIPEKENVLKKAVKKFCMKNAAAILSTSLDTDRFINHYCENAVPIYRHYFSSVYSSDIIEYDREKKLYFKKKYGLENKFTVICVGRFIPVKGFDILLKAARQLKDEAVFLFVGGTPTEGYNELISSLPSESVRFIDFVGKEKLKEYYLASDVFAMPSRGDVWGLVVGEAMATGLPVISSDKCLASKAMIEDDINGYIIESEDPRAYCDRIRKLKEDPKLCQKMILNNIEKIKQYAIDVSAKHDHETINKILESR